jgi:hypothetical protein
MSREYEHGGLCANCLNPIAPYDNDGRALTLLPHCSHRAFCSQSCNVAYQDTDATSIYYATSCYYCILRGERWEEEWDNRGELWSRAREIVEFGMKDGKRREEYFLDVAVLVEDEEKTEFEPLPHATSEFRDLYEIGFDAGRNVSDDE